MRSYLKRSVPHRYSSIGAGSREGRNWFVANTRLLTPLLNQHRQPRTYLADEAVKIGFRSWINANALRVDEDQVVFSIVYGYRHSPERRLLLQPPLHKFEEFRGERVPYENRYFQGSFRLWNAPVDATVALPFNAKVNKIATRKPLPQRVPRGFPFLIRKKRCFWIRLPKAAPFLRPKRAASKVRACGHKLLSSANLVSTT